MISENDARLVQRVVGSSGFCSDLHEWYESLALEFFDAPQQTVQAKHAAPPSSNSELFEAPPEALCEQFDISLLVGENFDFGPFIDDVCSHTQSLVPGVNSSLLRDYVQKKCRTQEQKAKFEILLFMKGVVGRNLSEIVDCLDGEWSHVSVQVSMKQRIANQLFTSHGSIEGNCLMQTEHMREGRVSAVNTYGSLTIVADSRIFRYNRPPLELATRHDGKVLFCSDERIVVLRVLGRQTATLTFHTFATNDIWVSTIRTPESSFLCGCCMDETSLLIAVVTSNGAYVCLKPHKNLGDSITIALPEFSKLVAACSNGRHTGLLFSLSNLTIGRFPLKLNSSSFSLECWIFMTTVDEHQIVFSHGDKATEEIVIEVFPSLRGVTVRGGSRSPRGGASYAACETPGGCLQSKWCHIGLVFSGMHWKLMINGHVGAIADACTGCPGVEETSCVIGKSFSGHIIEVRVWSRARSEPEIIRDMNRQLYGTEPGLIGYFPLSETGGIVIADRSRSHAHALVSSNATFCPLPNAPIANDESFQCDVTAQMLLRNVQMNATIKGKALAVSCPLTDGRSVLLEYDLDTLAQVQCCAFERTFESLVYVDDRITVMWIDKKSRNLNGFSVESRVSGWGLCGSWPSLWEAGSSLLQSLSQHRASLKAFQGNREKTVQRLLCITSHALKLQDERTVRSCQDIIAHLLPECGTVSILGDPFSDSNQLISTIPSLTESLTPREMLHWLAFRPHESSVLLRASLPLLLDTRAMLHAVTKLSGTSRSDVEDKLFLSCAEFLTTGASLHVLLTSKVERISQFVAALVEDLCLALRCKTATHSSVINNCLLRVHDALFRFRTDAIQSSAVVAYCMPLLKGMEKCILSASSTVRRDASLVTSVINSLESSFVGQLIPCLMDDIGNIPLSHVSGLIQSISLVRDAVASAVNVIGDAPWLTSTRGRLLGSSAKIASNLVFTAGESSKLCISKEMLDNLFRNGFRKAGTPRDAFIRNLLQGVGTVSRLLAEIQLEDMPLRVKDSGLLVLERQLTACFSNALLDDTVISQPTRESLVSVYRHVKGLRAWLLSQRQESYNSFEVIENRALFLCKFEPCTVVRTVVNPAEQHTTNSAKKWRRMFQAWKTMRSVKVLMSMLSSGQPQSPKDVAGCVTAFIQSSKPECEEIERSLQQRSARAQQRQTGYVALRGLLEEGRMHAGVDSITAPYIGRALCGRHYLVGVEGCSSETMLRLRAAFFQLMEEIVARLDTTIHSSALEEILIAALAAPWLPGDFLRLGSSAIRHAFLLVSQGSLSPSFGEAVKLHFVPLENMIVPRLENCSGGVSCGVETPTLRGSGSRGSFLAPITWKRCAKGHTQYFEVTLVELAPSATIGIGLGPSTFNVARPPGWDINSYALNSEDGVLFVESSTGRETGYTFGVGDVIGCGWNAQGDIFWTRNGKLLSVTVESNCSELCPLIGFDGKGTVAVNFGQFNFEHCVERSFKPVRSTASRAFDVLKLLIIRMVDVMKFSDAESASAENDGGRKLLEQVLNILVEAVDTVKAHPQYHKQWCKLIVMMCRKLRDRGGQPYVDGSNVCFAIIRLIRRASNLQLCSQALNALGGVLFFVSPSSLHGHRQEEVLRLLLDFASGDGVIHATGDWSDLCAWSAISVLRELNQCIGHPWSEVLHRQVILPSLKNPSEARRKLRVVLHILGGGEVIPQVGDKVLVKELRDSRAGELLQFSLADEVCSVLFQDSRMAQMVSVRHVSKHPDARPWMDKRCQWHQEQASAALDLAQRLFLTSPMDGESHSLLQLQLYVLRVLHHFSEVSMIEHAPLLKLVVDWSPSSHCVHRETHLIFEDTILTALEMRRVEVVDDDQLQSPNSQTTPVHSQNLDSIDDARTRMAQELSMRGFSLEMCMIALEETHYDRTAALRLLTDHHEDLLHVLQQENDADEGSEGDDGAPSEEDDDASGGHMEEGESSDPESSCASGSHISQRVSDGLRFDGDSYVKVGADSSIGPQFTIDFWVRPRSSLSTPEVVFLQPGNTGGTSMFIVIDRNSAMFGWGDVDDAVRTSEEQSIPGRGICCMELLADHDSNRWTRITCVQDCADITIFKNGTLRDSTVSSCAESLLGNDLYIGGCPLEWCQSGFTGDVKDVRVFETALSPEVVESMFSLTQAPNPAATSPFLVVHLRFDEGSFPVENSSASPNCISVTVTMSGTVVWLQSDSDQVDISVATAEIDFAAQSDFEDFTTLDLQHDANSFVSVWKQYRSLSSDELKQAHLPVMRDILGHISSSIILRAIHRCGVDDHVKFEDIATSTIRALTSFVLKSSDTQLLDMLTTALLHCCTQPSGVSILEAAYGQLSILSSAPQRISSYESPHPCKGYSESPKEVSGSNQHTLFFDQRCSAHAMLLTIYTDRTFGSVAAQYAASTLTSFRIKAPQFFFDVRIDSAVGSQWGYKLYVVSDDRCQVEAARLMRRILTYVQEFHVPYNTVLPSIADRTWMETFTTGIQGNSGKTRRLLMSIVTDILRFADLELSADGIELIRLQDIRKMAEKQFRRETAQLHHSRFVQIATAYFLSVRDAEHIVRCDTIVESADGIPVDPLKRFASKRIEQKKHYLSALRDGRDRVVVEKIRFPDCVRIEPNIDRTVAVWSERSGSSVIADVALSCGQWYFEVKMVATADVTIGVLSSNVGQLRSTHTEGESFSWGFNGRREGCERQWRARDVIGVVVDTSARNLLLFNNGSAVPITVPYGRRTSAEGGSDGAASAANNPLPHSSNQVDTNDDEVVSVYPYFVLGADEGVVLNFGATHFEFDIPGTALPLDPTHLSLGTLVPFNQVRSFEDVVSSIVVAGPSLHSGCEVQPQLFSSLLPPYFIDDADPFDCPTHRQGPPHVSLTSPPTGSDMLINILEVKNNGTQFTTVRSDCTVFGGRWYFEVVLASQGLMQVGWISGGDAAQVSVGDSPNSWAVDGFRRVKWHNSTPIPIGMTRRWIAGDIVGCSIDIDGRHVVFFLNGRQIAESYIPATASRDDGFAAAISMRAGNSVTFNFGSTPLRFKPDGFSPLGVPDTWHERIDTYYSTLSPSAILKRRSVVSEAAQVMRRVAKGVQSFPNTLRNLHSFVVSVDNYCASTGRSYLQLTGDAIASMLAESGNTLTPQVLGCAKIDECFQFLKNFARIATSSIPMLPLSSQGEGSVESMFLEAGCALLFRSVREQLVTSTLKETNCKSEHLRLTINRLRSRSLPQAGHGSGICDTVFGQTHELLRDQGPRVFRTNKRMWSVVFMGEGAEDVGGPYREHLGDMCRELMSTALPLFVPSANNSNNTGTHRDAYVPNPAATSELHLSMYTFLGRLMGGAMRGGEPLNLMLPPLFWTLLSTQRADDADLACIDKLCLQCTHELISSKEQFGQDGRELFDETFETERFVTTLSGGTTCALVENGASIPLTFDRCEEYVKLLLKCRLHESRTQLAAIRRGLLSVIPELVVALLSPEELEARICGSPDYTVAALRASTTYEGVTSEDRRVAFLWQALEDATPLQRRLFLKFVSGRERMPVQLRVLPMATQGETTAVLPRAATCFFAIEVPDYPSIDLFKDRLFYAIENCQDIDTDFRARDVEDDDGPELMMGVDGRHDDTASDTNAPTGE